MSSKDRDMQFKFMRIVCQLLYILIIRTSLDQDTKKKLGEEIEEFYKEYGV